MSRTARIVLAILMVVSVVFAAHAQIVDFETVPPNVATTDGQWISNEYASAPYNVTFAIVDKNNETTFVANPKIAKVGPPTTAFSGCDGVGDYPRPGQGLGESFLNDGGGFGVLQGDLLVTYSIPVSEASGVLIDVDHAEEWTITARDSTGSTVDQQVIMAPTGPNDPACDSQNSAAGPGNGKVAAWALRSPTHIAEITSILLKCTGTNDCGGFAFDNFSPATAPTPTPIPTVTPTPDAIDHYKCYKANDLKNPAFSKRTVDLVDQFETKTTDVLKPFLLCNPVSKDGGPILEPTSHLTCYKIKDTKGQLKFAKRRVQVDNQFGSLQLQATKAFFLCLPSEKTVLP